VVQGNEIVEREKRDRRFDTDELRRVQTSQPGMSQARARLCGRESAAPLCELRLLMSK
jgi:hypothetical protein